MYDKVLFLDVDGVLHRDVPEHEEDLFLPGCMQQLRLIIERTGAQVAAPLKPSGALSRHLLSPSLQRNSRQRFLLLIL